MKITPILTANRTNYNILIFGQKGYGKTSWVRGLIKNERRIIILDTLQYEYDERDGSIIADYRGLCEQLKRLPRLDTDSFRYVLKNTNDSAKIFNLFMHLRNTTLLVEEMDCYCDLNYIDPNLLEHMSRGRHRENNLISISRFPQEINTKIRQGCDVMISFHQSETNILKILATTNEEIARELPTLKKSEVRILKGEEYLEEFYNRFSTVKLREKEDEK